MNKNLKELAKKHSDYSVDEKSESNAERRGEALVDVAEKIYHTIGSEIGSDDGLFYFSAQEKERYVHSSACVGIFSKIMGNDKQAERIYDSINKEIGRKKWLYNFGFHDDGRMSTEKGTVNNASMAILAKLLGKDDEAEKIYKRVGKMIGLDDGLYRSSTRDSGVHVVPNALMGIAAKLLGKDEDAEIIYEKIKEKVELNGGLYDDGLGPETYGNAAMAVFLEIMGKENEAEKIAENLEEHMLNGTLFSEDKTLDNPVTHSNALMGIYYCLKAGKKLS